jgi:hypothetical protein
MGAGGIARLVLSLNGVNVFGGLALLTGSRCARDGFKPQGRPGIGSGAASFRHRK